ncbi:hypothetical protein Tco_0116474 [Tanacetum coccineum]
MGTPTQYLCDYWSGWVRLPSFRHCRGVTIDHTNAIENSVQSSVINEVKNQLPKYLLKAVSEYFQPRMESMVRDVLKKNPINLFSSSFTSADSLTEYELKHKLYDMMQKSRSFLVHKKHLGLYNDLINSMDIDEANEKGDKDTKKSCVSPTRIDLEFLSLCKV